MMPLTMARPGETVVIRKITGRDEVRQHLAELGFVVDESVTVISEMAKVGDTVTVAKLHGEGAVKRRIMDMGITKGVEIHIRKVAPLGDPMELNVRGYELSVRKADAEMIEIL